jgi:UDP-N-acetylmuramate dehydrogenase
MMSLREASEVTDESIVSRLPTVRGKYRLCAPLSDTTWFRVGGPAEVLFKPADVKDLADFVRSKPADIPLITLGVGSNIIVRDGGIDGVVVRLGRGFTDLTIDGDRLTAGAGNLDINVATFAAQHGLAGLEFLSGIPGTIGGALAMNAGAYGTEIKDVVIEAEVVDPQGIIHRLGLDDLLYSYRHCGLAKGWIFTSAVFQARVGDKASIEARMAEISAAREASQPVRARTGGSTFKNPSPHRAWEVIDAAGGRGMMLGSAQVSEKHCNFLINTGQATAAELERLGETVIDKVKAHSGIQLEWEIKIIGKP